MGCVCAKSVPIEDSWESPRERQLAPSAVPSQGMAPAKLSASAAVSSSMRDELVAVRLTAATLVESKQGNRAAGVNERDADMRRERQVHTSHQHLRMIGSIPNATEGEQVAAGWPPWLVAVAGEAIHGLVPRRADSFERLDKFVRGYGRCPPCFGFSGAALERFYFMYRALRRPDAPLLRLESEHLARQSSTQWEALKRLVQVLKLQHPNALWSTTMPYRDILPPVTDFE